jgi:hypothetical protein
VMQYCVILRSFRPDHTSTQCCTERDGLAMKVQSVRPKWFGCLIVLCLCFSFYLTEAPTRGFNDRLLSAERQVTCINAIVQLAE